jgi:hypothetical protein
LKNINDKNEKEYGSVIVGQHLYDERSGCDQRSERGMLVIPEPK